MRTSPDLSVQEVSERRNSVAVWLSLSHVRLIGSGPGCSCGFPSVVAEEPITWYEGMFEHEDDVERKEQLRSIHALIELMREVGEDVELFPVWTDDEDMPPHGTIDVSLDEIDAQTFFLNEHYLYRVRAARKS